MIYITLKYSNKNVGIIKNSKPFTKLKEKIVKNPYAIFGGQKSDPIDRDEVRDSERERR